MALCSNFPNLEWSFINALKPYAVVRPKIMFNMYLKNCSEWCKVNTYVFISSIPCYVSEQKLLKTLALLYCRTYA